VAEAGPRPSLDHGLDPLRAHAAADFDGRASRWNRARHHPPRGRRAPTGGPRAWRTREMQRGSLCSLPHRREACREPAAQDRCPARTSSSPSRARRPAPPARCRPSPSAWRQPWAETRRPDRRPVTWNSRCGRVATARTMPATEADPRSSSCLGTAEMQGRLWGTGRRDWSGAQRAVLRAVLNEAVFDALAVAHGTAAGSRWCGGGSPPAGG